MYHSDSHRYSTAMPTPAQILLFCLRPTLGRWLWWRYRVTVHRHGPAAAFRPPLLVLSNHVNFWDPFLIAFTFDQPVHFLSADGNFRGRGMRRLMAAAGAIPKAKARTDMESLRLLRERIAQRQIVALFPEGQRTWDGTTRPMLPATPKLARLLGAPVVMVQLRGAYLSKPRWARRVRRGRLEIHLTPLLSRAELAHSSRGEIASRISAALAWDDVTWAQRQGVRFVGRYRAEHAEQALWYCPRCDGWGTLRSGGDELVCSQCGHPTRMVSTGALTHGIGVGTYPASPPYSPAPETVAAWNAVQHAALCREITAVKTGGALPYRIPAMDYATGYRSRPLRPRGSVAVELGYESLTLIPVAGGSSRRKPLPAGVLPAAISIPVAQIRGIHVQYATQLEFYHDGALHVLRSQRPQDSVMRLEETVLALQELYKDGNH